MPLQENCTHLQKLCPDWQRYKCNGCNEARVAWEMGRISTLAYQLTVIACVKSATLSLGVIKIALLEKMMEEFELSKNSFCNRKKLRVKNTSRATRERQLGPGEWPCRSLEKGKKKKKKHGLPSLGFGSAEAPDSLLPAPPRFRANAEILHSRFRRHYRR
jgi:hypothetical protein